MKKSQQRRASQEQDIELGPISSTNAAASNNASSGASFSGASNMPAPLSNKQLFFPGASPTDTYKALYDKHKPETTTAPLPPVEDQSYTAWLKDYFWGWKKILPFSIITLTATIPTIFRYAFEKDSTYWSHTAAAAMAAATVGQGVKNTFDVNDISKEVFNLKANLITLNGTVEQRKANFAIHPGKAYKIRQLSNEIKEMLLAIPVLQKRTSLNLMANLLYAMAFFINFAISLSKSNDAKDETGENIDTAIFALGVVLYCWNTFIATQAQYFSDKIQKDSSALAVWLENLDDASTGFMFVNAASQHFTDLSSDTAITPTTAAFIREAKEEIDEDLSTTMMGNEQAFQNVMGVSRRQRMASSSDTSRLALSSTAAKGITGGGGSSRRQGGEQPAITPNNGNIQQQGQEQSFFSPV